MTAKTERESMDFDVMIVGAGPSGPSAACRLMQQANGAGQELTVCVLEKVSEVDVHILPGAVFVPPALQELFPDWADRGAPLTAPAIRDELYLLKDAEKALPKMTFPGGLLIGCDVGTLNFAKIKGLRTAMKSGLVAAETVFGAIADGDEGGRELTAFTFTWEASWAHAELKETASFGPMIHKYGSLGGGAYNLLDQLLGGKLPDVHDTTPDHATLKPASECNKIEYPRPDGKLSFDKPSSVFLSKTNHDEDQPCQLRLADPREPVAVR